VKSIDSFDGKGHIHRAKNYSRIVASELISCFFYITEPLYYNVPVSMFTIFDQIGEHVENMMTMSQGEMGRERERILSHNTHIPKCASPACPGPYITAWDIGLCSQCPACSVFLSGCVE
jgi:hypothetical protein